MSNVKAFVEGKQHVKSINPQRQAVGNQHRIRIPPTNLNRIDSNSMNNKPKMSSLHVGFSTAKRESYGSRQPSGFDTDAESLEDTTTVNELGKGEGSPQANRSLVLKERAFTKSNSESQSLFNSSYTKEGLSRFERESDASEYNEECSNESGGGGDQDLYSVTHLMSDFGSEEFANFKRSNVLDMNMIRNVQHSVPNTTKIGTAASSHAPVSVRRFDSVPTAKSPSPTHPNATFEVDAKLQYKDTQKIDNPSLRTNSYHVSDVNQLSKEPIVNQFGVPLFGAELNSRPSDRNACHSAHKIGTHKDTDHAPAKSPTATEQPAHVGAGNPQASFLPHNHCLSSSELSEDEHMEKVAASELHEDSLKRSRSLDHSPDQLASMTFQQLRDECFDYFPVPGTSTIPSELAKASLQANLENLSVVKISADRDSQQQAFFDSLTIDQHRESGELLGQRLGELITKISSIRAQKRKVAADFESEIAEREQYVRMKAAALKREKIVMTRQTEELTTGRPP